VNKTLTTLRYDNSFKKVIKNKIYNIASASHRTIYIMSSRHKCKIRTQYYIIRLVSLLTTVAAGCRNSNNRLSYHREDQAQNRNGITLNPFDNKHSGWIERTTAEDRAIIE